MWPRMRMPGWSACGCGKRARRQSPKPIRPGIVSMCAPTTASSWAARSIMRLTAEASQVGDSHSTQLCRPPSMALASNGRSMAPIAEVMRQLEVKAELGAGDPARQELRYLLPVGTGAHEVGDPQNLKMQLRLNGELRQDANTSDM